MDNFQQTSNPESLVDPWKQWSSDDWVLLPTPPFRSDPTSVVSFWRLDPPFIFVETGNFWLTRRQDSTSSIIPVSVKVCPRLSSEFFFYVVLFLGPGPRPTKENHEPNSFVNNEIILSRVWRTGATGRGVESEVPISLRLVSTRGWRNRLPLRTETVVMYTKCIDWRVRNTKVR